jgi:hypothetical protein
VRRGGAVVTPSEKARPVKGEAGGFGKYGITGLQFEGAEPPLAVVSLE